MNNIHILPTLALTGLAAFFTGCSQDTSPEPPSPQNAPIRFAAQTEYATRTGDITTNNLTTFNVYAYTGTDSVPVTFMNNVVVSKTGTNTWTYSPVEYWPSNESVDFYAFAPASWIGSSNPLKAVPYDASAGTEDIVYAVSLNRKGNTGVPNAQVVFNFRHALSKLTVKMSSTNTHLSVRVTNVALANIATRGNFTFPERSTSGTPNAQNIGTWTDQNTPLTYMLHVSQSPDDRITLTTTPIDMSTTGMGLGGAKYLIPQPLYWNNSGAAEDTYITVMCSVYDAVTGDKLWPNANTPADNVVEGSRYQDGLLKFPLSTSKFTQWEPGCHYIYNLVINSNDEMGTIDFGTPSVDTFIEVTTNYL